MTAKDDSQQGKAHEIDIHVGARVRQRRKALGISQVSMAEYVGLAFQQVHKYECGTNRISASKLYEFAEALQVPIDWFFPSGQEEKSHATDTDYEASPLSDSKEIRALIRSFVRIRSNAERRKVLELIQTIADGR